MDPRDLWDIENIFELVDENNNDFNNTPIYNEYTNDINENADYDPINNDFFI